jgi:sulfite reductase beta subunit-like hemoprotein
VSNPFANWSIADAELHNSRVSGKRVDVALVGEVAKHERDLHAQIFDECRRRGWIAFHGSMAERTHRTAGEPDFIILTDDKRALMVECKTATGKLSTEQQAMIAHAAKLGHMIHVVRSMQEFLKIL